MQQTPTMLIDALPAATRPLLAAAAAFCTAHGVRLWLVGGVIRDLLLSLPLGRDIDLAIEGDVAALADGMAAVLGGQVLARHDAFGTATIQAGRYTFDIARTRIERYAHPAVLPEVMPATIEADLIRRDFTINAIAMSLHPGDAAPQAGPLYDPFDGRGDLLAGRLRFLHDQSLRDDPTRLLRGVRLAARLGFRPDADGRAQIQAALEAGYLHVLSAERVMNELCLTLEEPAPEAALQLADEWGLTAQIIPGLQASPALLSRAERLRAARELPAPDAQAALIRLGLLTYDLSDTERSRLAQRYPLPSGPAALLRQVAQLKALTLDLYRADTPSAIAKLLHPFNASALAVLHYAEHGPPSSAAAEYLGRLRHIRAPLDGNDLRRLGVVPGPRMGRLLDDLRAAVLDGRIAGRAEAEAWVQTQLAD